MTMTPNYDPNEEVNNTGSCENSDISCYSQPCSFTPNHTTMMDNCKLETTPMDTVKLENDGPFVKIEPKVEVKCEELQTQLSTIKCFDEQDIQVKCEREPIKPLFMIGTPHDINPGDEFIKTENQRNLINGGERQLGVVYSYTGEFCEDGAINAECDEIDHFSDDTKQMYPITETNKCNGFLSQMKFQKPVKKHKILKYKCHICDRWFGNVANYKQHSEKHMRLKLKSVCDKCGKSFDNNQSFIKHQRVHTNERPYICKTCNKSFKQLSTLKTHIFTHTGERPYKCELCELSFRTAFAKKRHKKCHSGEKVHKCEVCGKTFIQRYNYQIHLLTHSGEKPHKCETCGATYKERIGLREHMRRHTGERPFKCELCGKRFDRRGYFLIHQKIHEENRAYKCAHCDKTFIRTCDVRRHERTHLKQKPFGCDLCGVSYSRKDTLKRHKMSCVGGDVCENKDKKKSNIKKKRGKNKILSNGVAK